MLFNPLEKVSMHKTSVRVHGCTFEDRTSHPQAALPSELCTSPLFILKGSHCLVPTEYALREVACHPLQTLAILLCTNLQKGSLGLNLFS